MLPFFSSSLDFSGHCLPPQRILTLHILLDMDDLRGWRHALPGVVLFVVSSQNSWPMWVLPIVKRGTIVKRLDLHLGTLSIRQLSPDGMQRGGASTINNRPWRNLSRIRPLMRFLTMPTLLKGKPGHGTGIERVGEAFLPRHNSHRLRRIFL